MPAPKGHPRYGGRTAGVPNKRFNIEALCEANGADPFLTMIKFLQGNDANLKFQAAKELCCYLLPKKRDLNVSGELNNPYAHMTLEELKELGKKKLDE